MIRRSLLTLVLCFGLAPAAEAETPAGAFVRKLGDEAVRILQTPDITLEQREAHLRTLLSNDFDLPLIGRFVLGRHWRNASEEMRTEYLEVFSEFILRTYSSRLGGYAGETLTVVSERDAGDGDLLVRTRIQRPSGPPIDADWRVRDGENGLRIIDVMVEGVSMALTQRSEFASVIQRDGVRGLIETLRARINKLPATNVAAN